MDELDQKLAALKAATDRLEPNGAAISALHAELDRVAGTAGPGLGSSPSAAARLAPKVGWLLGGIVIGGIAGYLVSNALAAPVACQPERTAAAPARAPTPFADPTPVVPLVTPASLSEPLPATPQDAPRLVPHASASACNGLLVATSIPDAEVLVDGLPSGRWTPILREAPLALPSDEHLIAFRSKEGGTATRIVDVECGKFIELVNVECGPSGETARAPRGPTAMVPLTPLPPGNDEPPPADTDDTDGVAGCLNCPTPTRRAQPPQAGAPPTFPQGRRTTAGEGTVGTPSQGALAGSTPSAPGEPALGQAARPTTTSPSGPRSVSTSPHLVSKEK
jgi:hypothetical protein